MTSITEDEYVAIYHHIVKSMLDYEGTSVYADVLSRYGCNDLRDF